MLLAVLYVCSLAACSSQLGGGSFLGCCMDEEQVQKAQCLAQGPTARRCQWGALNPCPASQVPCVVASGSGGSEQGAGNPVVRLCGEAWSLVRREGGRAGAPAARGRHGDHGCEQKSRLCISS